MTSDIKDEFKPKISGPLLLVSVYKDKELGIEVIVEDWRNSSKRQYAEMSPEEKQKHNEGMAKLREELDDLSIDSEKEHKPVDTSNWVKPDEETIRNALITSLIGCQVSKKGSNCFGIENTRAEILYGILHSTAPSNPQMLMNFVIEPYLDYALKEVGKWDITPSEKIRSYVCNKFSKNPDKNMPEYTAEMYQKDEAELEKKIITVL